MNEIIEELRELRYEMGRVCEKVATGHNLDQVDHLSIARGIRILAHHVEMIREKERP